MTNSSRVPGRRRRVGATLLLAGLIVVGAIFWVLIRGGEQEGALVLTVAFTGPGLDGIAMRDHYLDKNGNNLREGDEEAVDNPISVAPEYVAPE